MKLVIISTTIRGDEGYRDYDQLASQSKFKDVSFVISADLKSKPFNENGFVCNLHYILPEEQKKYTCSEYIGWNRIGRRNISLLKAIELNPDFILTVDDDNRPTPDYFDKWYDVISKPCSKEAKLKKTCVWHNYLETGDADIHLYPRGFPIPIRGEESTEIVSSNIDPEKIGVFQGISLGDPDIDAMTRITYSKPEPLKSVKEYNYCLKNIWSPYNTQNTVFARCVFPLAFTWPNSGRFEDIYASLVWQQFLFNNGMYVHIGDSMNYQIRGKRNDLRDLNLEIDGYFNTLNVWEGISEIAETDALKFIDKLAESKFVQNGCDAEFMVAFKKDVVNILKESNDIKRF